mgnify:CR=1 FL=1
MKKEIILLSPSNVGWKIFGTILTPFWVIYAMQHEDAKSFDEFWYGIIKHKHEFDKREEALSDGGKDYRYASCKHHGCKRCTIVHKVGHSKLDDNNEFVYLNIDGEYRKTKG